MGDLQVRFVWSCVVLAGIITGLAVQTASADVRGHRIKPAGQCASGVTELSPARTCATGWLNETPPTSHDGLTFSHDYGDFYEEDQATDSPWEKRLKSLRQLSLTRESCPAMKIMAMDDINRVLVQCTKDGGPVGAPVWVNMDYLKCAAAPSESPEPASSCSGPDSQPIPGKELKKQKQELGEIREHFRDHILGEAFALVSDTQRKLWEDHEALEKPFRGMENAQVYETVFRARERLKPLVHRMQAMFGERCNKTIVPQGEIYTVTDPEKNKTISYREADLDRAMRTCRLFLGSYYYAQGLLEKAAAAPNLPESDDKTKLKQAWGSSIRLNMSTNTIGLAEAMSNPTLYEGYMQERAGYGPVGRYRELVERQMMYYGLLPDGEISEADLHRKPARLEFVRRSREIPGVLELHNGYVYGGSRLRDGSDGKDCSDLVSRVLFKEGTPAPSTGVFMAIADHERLKDEWKPLASCFETVNFRNGEIPQPGDIAVMRGHIVFIKRFDEDNGMLNTIEAAGAKFNSVGEFKRPLFEANCMPGQDVFRADIRVLRFKPECAAANPLLKAKLAE